MCKYLISSLCCILSLKEIKTFMFTDILCQSFFYLSTLIVETQQYNQQHRALTCADPEGGTGGPDSPP